MTTFNAIDVETANPDRASICQIGIVHIENGKEIDRWQSLVNPEDWFDEFFTNEIHGISEGDVQDSPTMPEVRDELRKRLRGSVLVSHTGFDRVAFERAMNKYDLEQLEVTWLDSASIARRAWYERFGRRGYGLRVLASNLGIHFKHHDALEDARTAALIVLQACKATGLDIEGWLKRVRQPVVPSTKKSGTSQRSTVRRDAESDEFIVFTGTLSLKRRELADTAAEAGFNVRDNVTKDTTILVVGIQDKDKLRGFEKSRKHRLAEEKISSGQELQIFSEADFLDLIATTAQMLD